MEIAPHEGLMGESRFAKNGRSRMGRRTVTNVNLELWESVEMSWQNTRKPRREEAVEIQEKRFGYFPKTFRWHGKSYDVQAVERCWTIARRTPRLCFRVRCSEGTFDLAQDVRANIWHLKPV